MHILEDKLGSKGLFQALHDSNEGKQLAAVDDRSYKRLKLKLEELRLYGRIVDLVSWT